MDDQSLLIYASFYTFMKSKDNWTTDSCIIQF